MRCQVCPTILNRYNVTELCSIHQVKVNGVCPLLKVSCFECPFNDCILGSGQVSAIRKLERQVRAKELIMQGYTIEEISEQLNVSVCTVRKYMVE